MFFEKGIHSVQWGLGQSPRPEAREFSRIFVLKLKTNLTVCKVTETIQLSYRKEDRAKRPIYGCSGKF